MGVKGESPLRIFDLDEIKVVSAHFMKKNNLGFAFLLNQFIDYIFIELHQTLQAYFPIVRLRFRL